jgi:hypothetical protein
MSATTRSTVRTLTFTSRAANSRWTTTALPAAGPSYHSRASRRCSSVNRRAAGRVCTHAVPGCRKYRRTVLTETPTSRAIAFFPTPRFASVRIAVTTSPSITGTSDVGDTRTSLSSSIRPSSGGSELVS